MKPALRAVTADDAYRGARKIFDLRCKLNLTQEGFAQVLGVTVATINRWENGHTTPTRLARKALLELEEETNAHAH